MYIRRMGALLNGRSMGTKYGCDLWSQAVPTIKLKNNHLLNVLFFIITMQNQDISCYKNSVDPDQLADEAS